MPLINVKLIDGVFSPVQKKQIVERITDAMVSVEGEAMRPVTWVVIEEVKGGDWAIGGRTLTAADVHAMAGKEGGLTVRLQSKCGPRGGHAPSRGPTLPCALRLT
jgi:4-oxalocrotonate tautomerase